MKRILVIGGNGSGKTTFARLLSKKLNVPLIHLDKISRTDNWQRVDSDIFYNRLNEIFSTDSWIIDGNDIHTLPVRLKECDTVFYFDFNTVACLIGVIKRTIKYYGKHRDDVGGENNIEKFDKSKIAFFKSVVDFNKCNRKLLYHMLNENSDINTIIFKNRKQVRYYLNNIDF